MEQAADHAVQTQAAGEDLDRPLVAATAHRVIPVLALPTDPGIAGQALGSVRRAAPTDRLQVAGEGQAPALIVRRAVLVEESQAVLEIVYQMQVDAAAVKDAGPGDRSQVVDEIADRALAEATGHGAGLAAALPTDEVAVRDMAAAKMVVIQTNMTKVTGTTATKGTATKTTITKRTIVTAVITATTTMIAIDIGRTGGRG